MFLYLCREYSCYIAVSDLFFISFILTMSMFVLFPGVIMYTHFKMQEAKKPVLPSSESKASKVTES